MTMSMYGSQADYWKGRAEKAEAEAAEQARLNGMGSEREARLMARVEELEKSLGECTGALETADREIAALKAQEPVAWMCSDESLPRQGFSRFSRNCEGAWNIPVFAVPVADSQDAAMNMDNTGANGEPVFRPQTKRR